MDFDFKIKTKQDYSNFLKYLKSIAKNESVADKKRHVAILNTKQEVIAISMAEIRKTAKKILKNGYEKFLEISLKNDYMCEFYEETLIQGLVIAEIKDFEKQRELLDVWIHKIDNWATCDGTISSMKFLKKDVNKSDYFNYFYNLCFSNEEFVARFGIVVLMTYFLEDEFIDKILLMCERVKNEAYYVKMGLAWLISFAFMKFKEKTYNLLAKKTLDKFTQNKAISKCRDSYRVLSEDKEELIKFRIK